MSDFSLKARPVLASLRGAGYAGVLGLIALSQVGCSSGANVASMPVTQAASQFARTPESISAFPISISAFPVSISAFPILAGSPISIMAYPVCKAAPSLRTAACHGQYRSDILPILDPLLFSLLIPGFHPADLQQAYGLANASSASGEDQTVAIVVAFDAPALESDLNIYRNRFGLGSCKVSHGCLSFVNGNGVKPIADAAWAQEATLDAEMVSAVCPKCRIMIVEAKDADVANLAASVDTAAARHASVISNSYSAPEVPEVLQYASSYNHKGIPITAGAGDRGYGVGFPAVVPQVTSVGGTSLIRYHGGWAQAVWAATGSGCSAFMPKPAWQQDRGCEKRTMNDLAVVADPATGVSAYISGVGGWNEFGGTSVSAPIVAAMYALAGNGDQLDGTSRLYAHASEFTPVVPRSNGFCSPAYLCNGVWENYSGPAGLGGPFGLGAF
jgi:subtilase family serine protease